MAYELFSKRAIRLEMTAYERFLKLALHHGWKPAGTVEGNLEVLCDVGFPYDLIVPYRPKNQQVFVDQYLLTDSRIVLQEDALQIAEALEKALESTDHLELIQELFEFEIDRNDRQIIGVQLELDPLVDFIKFCRDGCFEIGYVWDGEF